MAYKPDIDQIATFESVYACRWLRTTMDWPDLLQPIGALLSEGRFDEIAERTRKCKEQFGDNPHAVSWANYNIYLALKVQQGIGPTLPMIPAILQSDINFAGKMACIVDALSYVSQQADMVRSRDFLHLAEACIETWCSGAPRSEDFEMIASRRVANFAHAIYGSQTPKLFEHVQADDAGHLLAHIDANNVALSAPLLANKIPGQLLYRMQANLPDRGISLLAFENISAFRCGSDIIFFNQSDRVLKYPHGKVPSFYEKALAKAKQNQTEIVRVEGCSIAICDQLSQIRNYCHWILDWLPRLLIANRFNVQYDHVVSAFPPDVDYERYSIDAASGTAEKCVSIDVEKLYVFDRLILSDDTGENYHHPAYNCHPELIYEIRDTLLRKAGVKPQTTAPARLYVPRKNSRTVLNNDELTELLSKYGFTSIDTDQLSLRDQIEIFSGAEAVIGPHGAALTNLAFCPSGTKVLELFPKFGGTSAYFSLCNTLRHRYSCYIDDISLPRHEAAISPSPIFNNASFLVDLDFVARWIKEEALG